MQKKIIAVACAVIMIATLFASCGKKIYTQEINGIQRPVVTDENGELVTDAQGLIKVYVTNADGELMTAEDGSPNYNFIQPPAALIQGDKVSLSNFELTVPKGFTADERGRLIKDKTDGNCYIAVGLAGTVSMENPFEAYVSQMIASNNEMVKQINDGKFVDKGYKTAEGDVKTIELSNGTQARSFGYKVLSPENEIVHYAVSVYFLIDDGIYCANYACLDGVGYDESFDFENWVKTDMIITANAKGPQVTTQAPAIDMTVSTTAQ